MRVKEGEDIGASGSSDQTIKIWSLKDGRLLNTIYTHSVRERGRRREGRGGGEGGGEAVFIVLFHTVKVNIIIINVHHAFPVFSVLLPYMYFYYVKSSIQLLKLLQIYSLL